MLNRYICSTFSVVSCLIKNVKFRKLTASFIWEKTRNLLCWVHYIELITIRLYSSYHGNEGASLAFSDVDSYVIIKNLLDYILNILSVFIRPPVGNSDMLTQEIYSVILPIRCMT
jgi:hypothetical protein